MSTRCSVPCTSTPSTGRSARFESLFSDTIDSATAYPREVVKPALACNAAAVILVNHHFGGDTDRRIA